MIELRLKLIEEEYKEVITAFASGSKYEIAKELADLKYVVVGAMITFGMDPDKCFECVHKSNMTKLGKDGKPIYREDGKVVKSELYEPADLFKVLGMYMEFHDGRVVLHIGDCFDVLDTLPRKQCGCGRERSSHALVSIVNRFSKTSENDEKITANCCKTRADGGYVVLLVVSWARNGTTTSSLQPGIMGEGLSSSETGRAYGGVRRH